MKTRNIFNAILLSALVLTAAVAAASAQNKTIAMLYGAGEATGQRVEIQRAAEPDEQAEEKRQTGELSATQWAEVVRAAEGLLGLPAAGGGPYSMGLAKGK